jgi:hypothetical protein
MQEHTLGSLKIRLFFWEFGALKIVDMVECLYSNGKCEGGGGRRGVRLLTARELVDRGGILSLGG